MRLRLGHSEAREIQMSVIANVEFTPIYDHRCLIGAEMGGTYRELLPELLFELAVLEA